jgi:hypothetical protein
MALEAETRGAAIERLAYVYMVYARAIGDRPRPEFVADLELAIRAVIQDTDAPPQGGLGVETSKPPPVKPSPARAPVWVPDPIAF